MIIPIGDINRRKTFPFVNYLLILANAGVFLWMSLQPEPGAAAFFRACALVPEAWSLETLVTSMFLHGGIAHLVGNMLFLWIAGDNVEDRLGHAAYLVFYLAAGLAGSAAHLAAVSPAMAGVPVVGASGAISGVMGAYLVFFPAGRIKFLLVLFVFVTSFTLPSWGAIGLWIVLQTFLALAELKGQGTMVAVWGHLGGFAAGFATALILRIFGGRAGK